MNCLYSIPVFIEEDFILRVLVIKAIWDRSHWLKIMSRTALGFMLTQMGKMTSALGAKSATAKQQ